MALQSQTFPQFWIFWTDTEMETLQSGARVLSLSSSSPSSSLSFPSHADGTERTGVTQYIIQRTMQRCNDDRAGYSFTHGTRTQINESARLQSVTVKATKGGRDRDHEKKRKEERNKKRRREKRTKSIKQIGSNRECRGCDCYRACNSLTTTTTVNHRTWPITCSRLPAGSSSNPKLALVPRADSSERSRLAGL